MAEKIWKEIKCKTCGAQDKALFQMQPSQSTDDVYCKEHLEETRKQRAGA